MAIDIKETLNELNRIERLQAQTELRVLQVKEEEAKINERLKAMGVKPEELNQRILQLEASIQQKLTLIQTLENPKE